MFHLSYIKPFITTEETGLFHTVCHFGLVQGKISCVFASFVATAGSPAGSEGEGELRDILLDSFCSFTTCYTYVFSA